MIKHIVLFKLERESQVENIFKAKEKIEALKEKIEQIKTIEVGIDIGFDKSALDFAIYSEFENIEDLRIYAEHSEHKKVVEFIKTFAIERKVVDYEI